MIGNSFQRYQSCFEYNDNSSLDAGNSPCKLSAQAVDLISSPPSPVPKNDKNYEVKTGDTLWKIARLELENSGIEKPTAQQTKLELELILDANKQNSPNMAANLNQILPGMKIEMPSVPSATTEVWEKKFSTDQLHSKWKDSHEMKINKHAARAHDTTAHATTAKVRPHHNHLLHDLEMKMLSLGKATIDGLHHWLNILPAKSFIKAQHEAERDGVHINISSAGRTYADQSRLYRQLHGHSPVAIPGTSNHETGMAIDVMNWQQAKPYLLAHGFVHGDGHGPLRNDPWHFKYIGSKIDV